MNRKAFLAWMDAQGKSKTAKRYADSLDAVSAKLESKNTNVWSGIFEYLIGRPPEKTIWDTKNISDFSRIYGQFMLMIDADEPDNRLFDAKKYAECFEYTHTKTHGADNRRLASALKAYRSFLVWNEYKDKYVDNFPETEHTNDGNQGSDDLLAAALKAGVRFWVYSPGAQASAWDAVRKDGVIALSYKEVGDFSKLGDKAAVVAAFQAAAGDEKSHVNGAAAVIDFRDAMKPSDFVFAKKGMTTYIGVGRVTGGFHYDAGNPEFPNRRTTDWFKVETHELADAKKAAPKTLTDITDDFDKVRKLWEAFGLGKVPPQEETPSSVNVLDSALRQFKAHRSDPDWVGKRGENDWTSCTVNTATREYFGKLDEAKVRAFDEAAFTELFCGVKDGAGKVTFSPMWSGNPGQGWSHVKKAYEADAAGVVGFLGDIAASPAMSALFARDDFKRPGGFGKSVVSELLMKFHPDCCFKYGGKTAEVFKRLGLLGFEPHADYDDTEYKRVLGIAATIKDKMSALGISQTLENELPPDYLTVNEFVGWAYENEDLIKEKVMAEKLKPVNSEGSVKKGTRKLSDAFKDDMMKRLAAALRTKPFAILAGHSGTGKSQLVRRLAYMTCNNEKLIAEGAGKTAPGNYCMVQVKPNWHDSTDLLGYYSDLGGRHFVNTPFVQFLCKAYAYRETPFFLCLDEMNLAPVEQYFAEYLSAVESMEKKDGAWVSDALVEAAKTGERDAAGNAKVDPDILLQIMQGAPSTEAADWIAKHGLTIPKNLFVVGTVNMDETTCQFSRKVLDRAMTLLMNGVKFSEMGKAVEPSQEALLDPDGIAFFLEGGRTGRVGTAEAGLLDKVNEPLANTPFVVAYRFANEYALYEEALAKLGGLAPVADEATDDAKKAYRENVSKQADEALDHVVLMKLLPRIHGMRDSVKGIFEGRKVDGKDVPGLKGTVKGGGLSAQMMDEILKRGDEYLTFWP